MYLFRGDSSLVAEVVRNRQRQTDLARMSHPARVFGADVEATPEVSTEMVAKKTCEIIIQTALPTLMESISASFIAKLQEFELDRARQQQELLHRLQDVLSVKKQFVNVNCSARHDGDLDIINLDVPRTVRESERIKGMFLPVSKFLRGMWRFLITTQP